MQAKIVQRIVQYKLAISLSSKPDFSDWVDASAFRARTAGAPPLCACQRSPFRHFEILAKVREDAGFRQPRDP